MDSHLLQLLQCRLIILSIPLPQHSWASVPWPCSMPFLGALPLERACLSYSLTWCLQTSPGSWGETAGTSVASIQALGGGDFWVSLPSLLRSSWCCPLLLPDPACPPAHLKDIPLLVVEEEAGGNTDLPTHTHTHTNIVTRAHTHAYMCVHTRAQTYTVLSLCNISFLFCELTALSRPAGAGQKSSTEQEMTLSSGASKLMLLP